MRQPQQVGSGVEPGGYWQSIPLGQAPILGDHAASAPRGSRQRVLIIGGGPGGYEAAIVATRMGANVTLVEDTGLGGAAVLTDVVPSKTLIATSDQVQEITSSGRIGVETGSVRVDLSRTNRRVRDLAQAQSVDLRKALLGLGVAIVDGRGKLLGGLDDSGRRLVQILPVGQGSEVEVLSADIVLLATGARPRELDTARPDGERILTWKQLYDLDSMPLHLIVVGSGVTGAEFAGAYRDLGCEVTLVSSRDRILPGEDGDAAEIIEKVFVERGMNIERRSRAASVVNRGDGVTVTLTDGREIEGSHCLMAVGAVPNTVDVGLEEAGVQMLPSGHVQVDRVSRTSAYRVYAAGDCTGVLPLASVAAQQGRIAMWHALGDSLDPLNLDNVAQAVFTSPEVASVGVTEARAAKDGMDVRIASLPLARNPRAKMQGVTDGFVKIIASAKGTVLGGVIVGPHASDLIAPLSIAVRQGLSVDELANASTIYPSMTGTVSEVARMLH